MVLMIVAIDEIFDRLIETFLDFSFEPFRGTGINLLRNPKNLRRLRKLRRHESCFEIYRVHRKFW